MLESVAAPFLCRETNQVRTGGSQDSGAVGYSLTRFGPPGDLGEICEHTR